MNRIIALILLTTGTVAAAGGPGDSALRFLEKVRERRVNLEPGGDTALAPQTGPKKRAEIARRLERLARDLGTDTLEIGPVKTDQDLAAVLVRKLGGFDPARLQVFPLALVRSGAGWLVAPVPASFENTGVGYSSPLRQRLTAMEDWMLRQQSADLEALREQSAGRLRERIEASLKADEVRAMSARQVGERFLAACEGRNLTEILGLLGGLSTALPENWSERLRIAETALHSPAAVSRPWRLLMAREVLRILTPASGSSDPNAEVIPVACLDPAGEGPRVSLPRIECVHLPLARQPDGIWRINPPSGWLAAEDTEATADVDPAVLEAFPSRLAAEHPATPAKSASAIRDAVFRAFQDARPAAWTRLIRIQGPPDMQRDACSRAAELWWRLTNPATTTKLIPLDFIENPDFAASACQVFDARHPERTDIVLLAFENTPAGWLWNPYPEQKNKESLDGWLASNQDHWDQTWLASLLADCPEVSDLDAAVAPTEAETRQLAEAWDAALRSQDLAAALRLTARLDQADSGPILLRNLGYELAGIRRSGNPTEVSAVLPGTKISAFATRARNADKPSRPLFAVVATASGPRILLEIDLIASSNRSRGFLNRTSLERLRNAHPQAAAELAGLFAKHEAEPPNRDESTKKPAP